MIPLDRIAIRISEEDNVAIAKTDVYTGTSVEVDGEIVEIQTFVKRGERFLIKDLNPGEPLKQYGHPFARSMGLTKGRAIGRYDLEDLGRVGGGRRAAVDDVSAPDIVDHLYAPKKYRDLRFKGFVRMDGQVGVRNHYVILPTSQCASDLAVKLSCLFDHDTGILGEFKNVDGVVAAAHTEGCGCNDGEVIDRVLLTLKNTVLNANVGGVLVVGLGCEKTDIETVSSYFGDMACLGKTVDFISIQGLGGTGGALEKGRAIIERRLGELDVAEREDATIGRLVVGTECGASDTFSGITANPLIGRTLDKIIGAGGSGLLSEIPEMVGAEEVLIDRMTNSEVVERFLAGISLYTETVNRHGATMNGNLVKGNQRGGLLNLALKSLGAVQKGGRSRIVDYVDYAERIRERGLTIMNGPGNDLESMTGMAAAGATIFLFSTGLGTTEGNLIAPVIKIPSTTETYLKMSDDMDFNAGRLMDEDISIDKLSDELLDLVIKVASGEETSAERWRKRSFQIWSPGRVSL